METRGIRKLKKLTIWELELQEASYSFCVATIFMDVAMGTKAGENHSSSLCLDYPSAAIGLVSCLYQCIMYAAACVDH